MPGTSSKINECYSVLRFRTDDSGLVAGTGRDGDQPSFRTGNSNRGSAAYSALVKANASRYLKGSDTVQRNYQVVLHKGECTLQPLQAVVIVEFNFCSHSN